MINKYTKPTKNTFNGGLNKDINKDFIDNSQYFDANNLSLVDGNNFFSLRNVAGTINVQAITGQSGVKCIGAFKNFYKIGANYNVECLTIFTVAPLNYLKIWCYDIVNDTLYELFQKSTPSDYITSDRIVQAVSQSENNIDILYFTDNYHQPQKLRCEIPTPYSPNFLTEFDLSLLRRGAIGKIQLSSVSSGGSLLTGSYQIAYQMIDPSTNRYTKFSLLTNPIKVFHNDGGMSFAGYGLASNKKIVINITPTTDELNNYSHFRLAIIENVYPEGTANTSASLTSTYSVASYLSGGSLVGIEIKSNLQNNLIDISELTIDHAPIKCVKTISARDNRLYIGNITYKDLSYDHPLGKPIVSSGSVLTFTTPNPSDSYNASIYTGYFRDEVYRFGISYFDDDGNFSPPVPLDMSNVTNNRSFQTGFKDMKFPDRSYVNGGYKFSVLNGVSPRQLGLNLTIDRHPTWARGFVILRLPRKKNIQWQSPLVPMMEVYGIGALNNYPTKYKSQNPWEDTTVSSAAPMGPNTTYIPMNLFWPKLRKISKTTQNTGSGSTKSLRGESVVTSSTEYQSYALVFPGQTMYTLNSPYSYNQSHKLKTVDAVKVNELYVNFTSNDTESHVPGLGINTSIGATFYALRHDLYYYDAGHDGTKPSLRVYTTSMDSYKEFDNLNEGGSVDGVDVYKYDNFETGGVSFSGISRAYAQKSVVIKTTDIVPINKTNNLSFADSVAPATASTNVSYTLGGTPTSEVKTVVPQTIEIVNCISGLGDDRYGDINSVQEFISTGTTYTFTDAELNTVRSGGSLPKSVDVWGGDCIVSPHLFKITDTTVVVPNNRKEISPEALQSVINRWEKTYNISGTVATIRMPVTVKNSATYIEIYLESEFNGAVTDINSLKLATGSTYLSSSLNGVRYAESESDFRVPLTYLYNLNISKQNDQKRFISLDPLSPVNRVLKSRIMYSDLKVYQTEIEGYDIFRVSNVHDLQETYGPISSLINTGDYLYCLQEGASLVLTIGERVLETTDLDTLSVRSGDVIGNVRYISTKRGCRHPQTVVTDGTNIFYCDNINKTINQIGADGFKIISASGMESEFRTKLNSLIDENGLIGVLDPVKNEYWIANNDGSFCYVYNFRLNTWISNYQFSSNNLQSSVYTNQKLYLIGQGSDNNQLSIHEMYTGNPSYFMGNYVVPSVEFIINDQNEISKTFDDIFYTAGDRLDFANFIVERESLLGDQVINAVSLNVGSRGEGTFKLKIPYDSSGARARGVKMKVKFHWKTGANQPFVGLVSVITKYRLSENIM